jgi:hypothetical protein
LRSFGVPGVWLVFSYLAFAVVRGSGWRAVVMAATWASHLGPRVGSWQSQRDALQGKRKPLYVLERKLLLLVEADARGARTRVSQPSFYFTETTPAC